MTRPGYGIPHPDVRVFLATQDPRRRPSGGLALRRTATDRIGASDHCVAPVLVGSARCIVFVHYPHRDPIQSGWPHPYPDFFQVIDTAEAELEQLPISETERVLLRCSRGR